MNDSLIYLLNVPELDVNNNNSFTFKNYDEQYNYFVSKIVKQVNGTKYIRKQKDSIKVNYSYNDCIKVNYAMINNDNKWLYFFIIDRVYVSEKVTNLILKLDVIQTYLFEFKFYDCFIERQHVDRWNSKGLPIVNLIEEGLEVGEYVVKNKTTLYDFNNKGAYIIASGDMIGNTSFGDEGSSGGTSGGSGESGGTTTNNNSFVNYKVSKEMLACLKSYEGYFDYAYDLGDGTMTIGYGTTSAAHLSDYNSLVANCTEKKATEIMCKHLENNYAKGILDTMHSKGLKDTDIKQNEFDAFVDLAYNCGVYGATSSPMFEGYCNKKSADEVCADWGTYYINPGTNVEQGLRNRRQKEINIFKNGTYQFTGITKNGNSKLDDNGGYGYIPDGYGTSNNSNTPSLKQRIVDSARKLIARPYVYGGNCPPLGTSTGTDCSGLTQWAYYDNGINIPRSTYQQINIGKEVNIGDLQIADLVFSYFSAANIPEHVFIISKIENGTYYCVEAQQEGTNISEHTFTPTSNMRFRRVI